MYDDIHVFSNCVTCHPLGSGSNTTVQCNEHEKRETYHDQSEVKKYNTESGYNNHIHVYIPKTTTHQRHFWNSKHGNMIKWSRGKKDTIQTQNELHINKI